MLCLGGTPGGGAPSSRGNCLAGGGDGDVETVRKGGNIAFGPVSQVGSGGDAGAAGDAAAADGDGKIVGLCSAVTEPTVAERGVAGTLASSVAIRLVGSAVTAVIVAILLNVACAVSFMRPLIVNSLPS